MPVRRANSMSVDNSKNEINKFTNSRNSQNLQPVNRSIESLKNSRDQRREDRHFNRALPTIQEDFVDDYGDHSRLGLIKKSKDSNKENVSPPLSVRDSYDQLNTRNQSKYRALVPPKDML